MIHFDLDGVIRDLCKSTLGKQPTSWFQKIDGKDICQIIEENLDVLVNSKPTEYYESIVKLKKISIITAQPIHWREKTKNWILDHFKYNDIYLTFVEDGKKKLELLGENDIIVEDFPLFDDYSKVCLIDRPYNREVKGEVLRIYKPEELQKFILENIDRR